LENFKFFPHRPITEVMSRPIRNDGAPVAAADSSSAGALARRGAAIRPASGPGGVPRPAAALSVSRAAAICGVGRTTVGYWVRSGKLFARRSGRSYSIPVEDLLHFLAASGQPIPAALKPAGATGLLFKSFRPCWEYWKPDAGHQCSRCLAFRRRVEECFCIDDPAARACPVACGECRYFREMVGARIQFVHQIDCPAAVFKGLALWGANAAWGANCRLPEDGLAGAGLETMVHPSALGALIAAFKRVGLGEKGVLVPGPVFPGETRSDTGRMAAWVFPLREPEDTRLVLAVPAPVVAGLRAP
jgi:excisionase family DNA binding protein